MGELFHPYPRLPKNVRQIGERETLVKLYVEDYVNTYLKRLYPAGGRDLRVGILLGTSEVYEGTPYLFIDGALEMEEAAVSGEKVTLTEADWKKAYKSMEETFPKRTVQGWFVCGAPGSCLSPLNYLRQHNQYFSGKNQLMYLNSGMDGEEAVYTASEDGFYRLKGYQVYYERNQMMQDYMILRKDSHRVESGSGDGVIRDFRTRMEERKAEAVSHYSTIRALGTLCSVLSVVVLAGGVVMFNNYQKMKEMESVLVSVLPEQVKRLSDAVLPEESLNGQETLIVEEIRGSVTPETMPPETKTLPPQSETEPSAEISTFGAGGNATADQDYPVSSVKPGESYLIGEGETLYGICFKLYGSLNYLDEIRSLNELDDADHIVAGQKLILPDLS